MAYNLSGNIPEVWSSKAIISRDANTVVASLVDRTYEAELTFGDTLHVPSVSDLTVYDVNNTGADMTFNQIDSSTTTDITVDKHKAVPFFVTKRDQKQMMVAESFVDRHLEKSGAQLAETIDTDLLTAGVAAASTSLGAYGTDITDQVLRNLAAAFDVANVPSQDRFLVVYPDQIAALRNVDKIVRADSLGDRNRITKAYEIPENGYFGEVYGIHIYTTTLVPSYVGSPAGNTNLAFQRSGLALLQQMSIQFERDYDIRSQRWDFVATTLYGVKAMRNDHIIKVLS